MVSVLSVSPFEDSGTSQLCRMMDDFYVLSSPCLFGIKKKLCASKKGALQTLAEGRRTATV